MNNEYVMYLSPCCLVRIEYHSVFANYWCDACKTHYYRRITEPMKITINLR